MLVAIVFDNVKQYSSKKCSFQNFLCKYYLVFFLFNLTLSTKYLSTVLLTTALANISKKEISKLDIFLLNNVIPFV